MQPALCAQYSRIGHESRQVRKGEFEWVANTVLWFTLL